MLQLNTVKQILDVLKNVLRLHREGRRTIEAYRIAVQIVSQKNGVTYQTIADGCRRRLGLTEVSEFVDLLEKWISGNEKPLKDLIKSNAVYGIRDEVDNFFSEKSDTLQSNDTGLPETSLNIEPNIFSIKLKPNIKKMVDILSHNEKITAESYLCEMVERTIKNEFKKLTDQLL